MTKAERNLQARQAAVDWAIAIAKNDDYGYKYYDKTDHACPHCHPKTKVKGYNCIGLGAAAYAHGAGDKRMLKNCDKNNGAGLGNNATLNKNIKANWTKHNGVNWKMIKGDTKLGGADIKVEKLQIGDILICYDNDGKYKHIAIYIGNGKIVDATSSRGIKVRAYRTLCKSLHVTRAFRYTGVGKF